MISPRLSKKMAVFKRRSSHTLQEDGYVSDDPGTLRAFKEADFGFRRCQSAGGVSPSLQEGGISNTSIPYREGKTKFRQRLSETIQSDETCRRLAMARVPFSSMFYCSNPLAAALTRRRTQIFFVALALLGNVSEFWPAEVFKEHTLRVASQVRFSALEWRGGCQNATCLTSPGVSSFGLTLRGEDLTVEKKQVQVQQHIEGPSIRLVFSAPVEFNGWYFTTSDLDPAGAGHTTHPCYAAC